MDTLVYFFNIKDMYNFFFIIPKNICAYCKNFAN